MEHVYAHALAEQQQQPKRLPLGDIGGGNLPASANPSCKRKKKVEKSPAMHRRNERERNRVKLLNLGFERLRQVVPHEEEERLSKISTLRTAICYIRSLQQLLREDDARLWAQGGISSAGTSPDMWPEPSEHHQEEALDLDFEQYEADLDLEVDIDT